MAEVLVEFIDPVEDERGSRYVARACGGEADNGMWQGWVEFIPTSGGPTLRSGRETTQPNRQDTIYWATGLTTVYLEGALRRAMLSAEPAQVEPPRKPAYPGPAASAGRAAILDPFALFRKGEAALRAHLATLARRDLVGIVRSHRLTDLSGATIARLRDSELIELIVSAARAREHSGVR